MSRVPHCFLQNLQDVWAECLIVSFQLFESILLTLPRQSSKGGKSAGDVIQELASDILGKLPADFDVEYVSEALQKYKNELLHDKTNKMNCAPSEDSDQSGYPLSLISLRCPHEET